MRVANPGSRAGAGRGAGSAYNWRALRRLLFGGDMGLAEAYLDGDWDSPGRRQADRAGGVERRCDRTAFRTARSCRAFCGGMGHARHANTRRGARRNIEAHYDLGNDFYGRWLDEGMTYSSAMFAQPGHDVWRMRSAPSRTG